MKKRTIDLYMLNGFLGSGKTTLLLKLLNMFRDKKVAVIMNEFGKISVDGKLIRTGDIEVSEINKGSIFCSCRSDKFIEVLLELSKKDLDIIFVESTGLANPSTLTEVLGILDKKAESQLTFKGAIGVVDATNISKLVQVAVMLKQQVAVSDLLILNKVDLVEKEDLEKTKALLSSINPHAPIVETVYCHIPESIFLDGLTIEPNKKLPPNQLAIGTQNVLVKIPERLSIKALEEWLNAFSDYAYRIKGFVNCIEGWVFAEGIHGQVKVKESNGEQQTSFLVVLAAGNKPIIDKMKDAWCKVSDKKLNIE